MTTDPAGHVDIADRLRSPANWLRQDRGEEWKDAVNRYDTTPFEAAAEIERLRTVLTETHAKIDAVLRGNHAGWAQALSDIRAALAPAEEEKG